MTILTKFIPKGPINNIAAMVQVMAWRRLGDKPLSAPMVDSLLTHIYVTQPQWVIENYHNYCSYYTKLSKVSVHILCYIPLIHLIDYFRFVR